ncbi:hypothetical protein DPMN_193806 [Dreissena polymorpha]|uniref:Uncharacterized protein n=1 Tax=Dreissena polymorpha TaxID=45954 RepID=A0A9D3Y409_DREPO|nr:hypothetical protein DPMN_193806 [Dreissena polymorpha]
MADMFPQRFDFWHCDNCKNIARSASEVNTGCTYLEIEMYLFQDPSGKERRHKIHEMIMDIK